MIIGLQIALCPSIDVLVRLDVLDYNLNPQVVFSSQPYNPALDFDLQ